MITGAQRLACRGNKTTNHFVATGVAATIIDVLEIIDITHQH